VSRLRKRVWLAAGRTEPLTGAGLLGSWDDGMGWDGMDDGEYQKQKDSQHVSVWIRGMARGAQRWQRARFVPSTGSWTERVGWSVTDSRKAAQQQTTVVAVVLSAFVGWWSQQPGLTHPIMKQ
jgi:hypothetical protein